MSTSRKILCGIYAAVAAVALVATWTQNAAYFGAGPGFLKDFLLDLRVNPASRSITLDILLFLLAAVIFMVVEARKTGVRYVWAYVVGSVLVAISVTFPLFLIARERRQAATDQPSPKLLDVIGLTVFAALIAAQAVFTARG